LPNVLCIATVVAVTAVVAAACRWFDYIFLHTNLDLKLLQK
jgi:hypothetical protein